MSQFPSGVPVPRQQPMPYDPQRYQELVQRLGQALLQVAPPDWRRIDLRILMTVAVSDLQLTVITRDGGSPVVDTPRDCTLIAGELRSMMYRRDQGTWFGMRFMMDPPSAYWISFNGEFDPLWDPPIPAHVWAQDLAVFPRADEHVPHWLRERLAEPAGTGGYG
jgi:hypothetical protein